MNISTAVTREETALLQSIARDRVVYEAGALLGHSTIALAQVAKRVVSVDPHEGYPAHAPRSTWHAFLANVPAAGVSERVHVVRSSFADHLPTSEEVAWADLTGSGALMHEFLKAAAHVPIIAVHDYGRSGCGDSSAVIDSWLRVNRRKVTRVGTLIVMAV